MDDLFQALQKNIQGEVRFDAMTRALYSTDASIYQIEPRGVVLPRTRADLVTAAQLCIEHQVALIARGAGTNQTGACLGRGVIIDCSKYLHNVIEVNPEEQWARVEPGVVPDELNAELRKSGLMFAVDISPANRANIGGMCGTNAGGSRSIRYGIMKDNVLGLDVMLNDGQTIKAQPLSPDELQAKCRRDDLEGQVYRTISQLTDKHRPAIRERYPKIQRRVGGYNLDAFVDPQKPFSLADLLVGSEGTLAVTLEARVRLVRRPPHTAVAVLHFDTIAHALESTMEILRYDPQAVELVDKFSLDLTRAQLAFGRRMGFVQGDPGALLLVEFAGDSAAMVKSQVEELDRQRARLGSYASTLAIETAVQQNIWAVRKAGLGLLLGAKGDTKPFAFVEDSAVPPERVASYFRRFDRIIREHDTRAAYYGHASVGLLHIRPMIDLKRITEIQKMRSIAEAVMELALEYGGAISGEHGDGLSRSEFNERVFGTELYNAFREVKRTFDPKDLFNPNKITDAPPMTENLRFGPAYRAQPIKTFFSFEREGGFERAIEMCNGNGECRKRLTGTMCPSYMVTSEEKHSTRGRANALRAALSGHLPAEALTGDELYDVLDLCLECKGCKGECPSNVDMAKLKYEFLAQYYTRHPMPLRSRLFGHIASLNQIGHTFAPVSNWVAGSAPFHWLLDRFVGIDSRRTLPPFARQTFAEWFRKTPRATRADPSRTVALLNDTYTNFNAPSIGRAAVKVLEALGYSVVLAEMQCCGRPMISKGLISAARSHARANVTSLARYAEQSIPVIGLEPSCLLTLRDEYPDLVDDSRAEQVAHNALMIEEFLARELDAKPDVLSFQSVPREILLHGHCHQKALIGTASSLRVLGALNTTVREIDSGCCGMAGSFGYEKEHYEVSKAIGARRLMPAIQAAPDAAIVASGISCRQQVAHFTGRKAVHLIELVADCLAESPVVV